MTAKEFVISKMPNARAERQTTNGGVKYWLIRNGRSYMWFADGKTEREAWKNAKQRMLNATDKAQTT